MPFSETWNVLRAAASSGTIIPNWTVHSGKIGEPFTISELTATVVIVNAPGAATPQQVSRDDFEVVYERWDDSKHKAMLRSDFSPLTRYSQVCDQHLSLARIAPRRLAAISGVGKRGHNSS